MGKIFILEDEVNVNRGISVSLEKEGHKVYFCMLLKEAKKHDLLFQPDIVICEINLPDGSGLDFIKWFRKHRDVYVICLTALDQEMDQVLGYEAGADDYITKPFSLSVWKLLFRTVSLLRKSSSFLSFQSFSISFAGTH